MTLTLEIPSALSEELEQQAELMGVSPEEHATALLALAAALLGIEDPRSLEGPPDQLHATLPRSDAQAAAITAWLSRLLLKEGVESDRLLRFAQRIHQWLALRELSGSNIVAPARQSAFGKYAHILGNSDDFARRKQEEIDLEDGRAA